MSFGHLALNPCVVWIPQYSNVAHFLFSPVLLRENNTVGTQNNDNNDKKMNIYYVFNNSYSFCAILIICNLENKHFSFFFSDQKENSIITG